MGKAPERGPISAIVRATSRLLQGRIHFPKDRLGEMIEAGGAFEIFRHMILDPVNDPPEKPSAITSVRFRFASLSPNMNRKTSLIPIPFIVAQPGFRSKIWALNRKSGEFQGIYE